MKKLNLLIWGLVLAFSFIAFSAVDGMTWGQQVASQLFANNGTRVREVGMDASSRALSTIDWTHQLIHEGGSFTAHYAITTAATDDHRSGIYLLTGAVPVHMLFAFSASAAGEYFICEAPTIAADTGTDGVAVFNRYRDSTTASTVSDNATPQVVNKVSTISEAEFAGDGGWACGTEIRNAPMEVGTGPRTAGGEARGAQEYILKAGVAYVAMIQNVGANANAHHVFLDWYEHIKDAD